MATYTSEYPTAHNDTYVKATSTVVGGYDSWNATDPAKSLTGGGPTNNWVDNNIATNQRFHIDLGSSKIIRRIYYENSHSSGSNTTWGAKNFTFWGSNDSGSFAELTYGTDTGWTQLTTATSVFDQHTAADTADPKYILVTNTTPYRYYAIKIADSYDVGWVSLRRIVMQTEDGFTVGGGILLFM